VKNVSLFNSRFSNGLILLEQGFPTFSRSRTTWAPRIVNAYHFFQNN